MSANFNKTWPTDEHFKTEIVNASEERNITAPVDDGDSRYWDGNATCSSDYDANFTMSLKRQGAIPDYQDCQDNKKQREMMPVSPDDNNGAHLLTGINVLLFDGTYYDLVGFQEVSAVRKMGSIIGLCKACPGYVTIKGCQGVSSNFLHHLKHRHPQLYIDFLSKKGSYSKRHRRIMVPMKALQNSDQSASSAPAEQSEESLPDLTNQSDVTTQNMQDFKDTRMEEYNESMQFRDRLLNFFTTATLPLHLVDNPHFQQLFCSTGITLPNTSQLTALVKMNFTNCLLNIKHALAKCDYYCTTLDIFTDGGCSFLAYTCHWLDKQQAYERNSAALVCRRLNKTLTADELNIITNVNNTYQLCNSKIVRTILNNGYCLQTDLLEFLGLHETEVSSVFINACSVDFQKIPQIMLPEVSNSNCAYKTFNEFCSNGLLKAIKEADFAIEELHKETFVMLTRLWQRLREYPVDKNYFSAPKDISFISIYTAISALLKHKDTLATACESLFVPKFRPDQIEYLEELCEIMSTIFNAVDYLQKPENMYYGYLFATVISLKVKLKKLLKLNALKTLRAVCEKLIERLNVKYKEFFELQESAVDAFVAAVTCPTIKLKMANVLRETAHQYDLNGMKQIVLNCAAMMSEPADTKNVQMTVKTKIDEDFLDFDEMRTETEGHDLFRQELEQYLSDQSTSINSIQQYPTIERLFLKYNTPLPSAMPVQSLLEFKEILNSSARWDVHFEQQLLYKANAKFR